MGSPPGLAGLVLVCPSLAAVMDLQCPSSEVVDLEYGQRGVLPCNFQSQLITWGDGTLNADCTKVPLVSLHDNSDKSGSGYESREYDILQNGSLVINSVQLHHELTFEVLVFTEEETSFICNVEVHVYVRPVPDHPVLNGHNQQYMEIEAGRRDVLYCSMRNVRPAVNLEIVAHNINHPEGVLFHNSSVTLDNGDGTFDVSLSVQYEVSDLSLEQLSVACRVLDSHIFSEETGARIILPPAPPTPVIENCNGTDGVCVVSLNETGVLSCRVGELPISDLRLIWEVLEGKNDLEMNRDVVTTTPCADGGCNTKITSPCSMIGEDSAMVRCSLVSTENKALVSSRVAYLHYYEPECVVQPEEKGVPSVLIWMIAIMSVFLIVISLLLGVGITLMLVEQKKMQNQDLQDDTQQDGESSGILIPFNTVVVENQGPHDVTLLDDEHRSAGIPLTIGVVQWKRMNCEMIPAHYHPFDHYEEMISRLGEEFDHRFQGSCRRDEYCR